MRWKRVTGLIGLFLVLGAAGWLLLDWYHVFGEPFSGRRVYITASLDASLRLDDGSVDAIGGGYVRAGQRSGCWPLTNGLPLMFIVVVAGVTVGRQLTVGRPG